MMRHFGSVKVVYFDPWRPDEFGCPGCPILCQKAMDKKWRFRKRHFLSIAFWQSIGQPGQPNSSGRQGSKYTTLTDPKWRIMKGGNSVSVPGPYFNHRNIGRFGNGDR